jgi:predicted nuclease of predicted toxin-antitoxin system
VARLYADENVSARVVARLLELGHDVLTAADDGRANQTIPDEDVLSRATELDRCVITNNRRHFHRLHARDPDHAGILTFTTDTESEALADRIHDALGAGESQKGRLVRVVRPNP